MNFLPRGMLVVAFTACAAVTLAACTLQTPGVVATPGSDGTVESPPPATTPSPSLNRVLTLPLTCSDFLGSEIESELLTAGIPLLTAPDGTGALPDYGAIGYFDLQSDVAQKMTQPTVAAFNCGYGVDISDPNGVGFEVQPLTAAARANLLSVLRATEVVEVQTGDVVTFTDVAEIDNIFVESDSIVIVHAVYGDSWVTVFTLVADDTVVDRIGRWLPILYERLHPAV